MILARSIYRFVELKVDLKTKERKSMARQSIQDERVMLINGYAVFMGYLMMGVRGVGRIGYYLEHSCPPRWLRLCSGKEGLLAYNGNYARPNCWLHRDHHAEWSSIAEESLELMIGLMATPGETGTKLRSEIISENSKAIISTLGSILECCNCTLRLQEQAVKTLLDLSVDPSSIIGDGNGTRCVVPLTWILLYIFLMPDHYFSYWYSYRYGSAIHRWKKSICIRRLVGEKLSAMLPLQSEGSATSRLQYVRVVPGDLSRALVHVGNISNRLHASYYLTRLCMETKDDEYLKEVRNTMVDVMLKLLKEILGWTRDATQAVTEANDVLFSVQDIDLESAGVSQGNGEENTSSSQQQRREQYEYMKLREKWIYFCDEIRLISSKEGTGLTRQLDEIAEKICLEQGKPVKNFEDLVFDAKTKLSNG